MILAQHASAQDYTVGYPAPGGNSFSGAGNAGQTGGANLDYSNFDLSASGSLYWTLQSIDNPIQTGSSPTGEMAFSSYNAGTGIATWTSTQNVSWTSDSGTVSVPVTFELQFQPAGSATGGPIGAGFLAPTTAGAVGIATLPSNQVVLDVTGNYQVWEEYTAGGSGGGEALLAYYDSTHAVGSAGLTTSSSGAFYSTAVPEPSSWALIATALAGLLFYRRQVPRAFLRRP